MHIQKGKRDGRWEGGRKGSRQRGGLVLIAGRQKRNSGKEAIEMLGGKRSRKSNICIGSKDGRLTGSRAEGKHGKQRGKYEGKKVDRQADRQRLGFFSLPIFNTFDLLPKP